MARSGRNRGGSEAWSRRQRSSQRSGALHPVRSALASPNADRTRRFRGATVSWVVVKFPPGPKSIIRSASGSGPELFRSKLSATTRRCHSLRSTSRWCYSCRVGARRADLEVAVVGAGGAARGNRGRRRAATPVLERAVLEVVDLADRDRGRGRGGERRKQPAVEERSAHRALPPRMPSYSRRRLERHGFPDPGTDPAQAPRVTFDNTRSAKFPVGKPLGAARRWDHPRIHPYPRRRLAPRPELGSARAAEACEAGAPQESELPPRRWREPDARDMRSSSPCANDRYPARCDQITLARATRRWTARSLSKGLPRAGRGAAPRSRALHAAALRRDAGLPGKRFPPATPLACLLRSMPAPLRFYASREGSHRFGSPSSSDRRAQFFPCFDEPAISPLPDSRHDDTREHVISTADSAHAPPAGVASSRFAETLPLELTGGARRGPLEASATVRAGVQRFAYGTRRQSCLRSARRGARACLARLDVFGLPSPTVKLDLVAVSDSSSRRQGHAGAVSSARRCCCSTPRPRRSPSASARRR